ncbi:MBL fold metallo-hydrolase [Mucilaginibacter daejeonensis]|uniref:MBL fold metallo-hydrolase n=1 Tax=Mucilaginibacter daejeonensis TaxID=398049 RepID=UPI001D176F67|nr:MBL fold metallo-hydrolase [Mucilaginibacter daejeonensis]UEG52407.1 MBL fold metallo-hydrolase [Mucilaginibacter daejeonensis]
MALYIASLNSGSNGNCYYVGNHREAILVDAGLSCRETERRMLRLGLNMQKVKAIFISHEHSDHIRGLEVLSKKYQLPVYITSATMQYGKLFLQRELVRPFRGHEAIRIGDLSVTAFPKYHDAAEPHSFLVSNGQVRVGVFTDIGVPCAHLVTYFKQCHAAFLEANYDEQMLATGRYPYHLKRRITGGRGHLSNKQALDLFIDHKPHFMSHLLLAHLSKDNNCPKLALELFAAHAGRTHVTVASRYEESPVFKVSNELGNEVSVTNTVPAFSTTQFSLF